MAYAQTAKKVLSSKGVQTTLTYVAIAVAVYIAYRLMAKTIKGVAMGVALSVIAVTVQSVEL